MNNMLIIYTNEEGNLSLCIAAGKEDLLAQFRQYPDNTDEVHKSRLRNYIDSQWENEIKNENKRLKYLGELKKHIYKTEMLTPENEEEFYKKLVWSTVPDSAINPREINISDVPSWQFRDAWCDKTPLSRIDIDLEKAKEIQLKKFRLARNNQLNLSDKKIQAAMETGNLDEISKIKKYRQNLRDSTIPLKNLQVTGYNDDKVLKHILQLGNPDTLLTMEGDV